MRYWKEIKADIQSRKRRNEVTNAIFYITTSKAVYDEEELMSNNAFQEAIGLLKKYMGEKNYIRVDSVEGCWDLNRVWYKFSNIPCGVEYSGVYPLDWEWEDVKRLVELIDSGAIWITVKVWDRKDKNYIFIW